MPSLGRALVIPAVAVAIAGCDGCRSKKPPPADAAVAACPRAPLSGSGDATYYDANGTGSCSFDAIALDRAGAALDAPAAGSAARPGDRDAAAATSTTDRARAVPPAGPLVAALNGPDYASATWCGACLEVRGPAGDVVVQVVDQCPGCKHGDLDLSRAAFARIAPLDAGRVPITWHEVACPVTGPIAFRIKPQSNPSWLAVQIRNHRYAIAGVETRDATGALRTLVRGRYNYFVGRGLGAGPFALRVTDVHGHVVDDASVALDTAAARPGDAQFPACP